MRYCPACHSVFPNEFRTCPKDQAELRSASEAALDAFKAALSLDPGNREAAAGVRNAGQQIQARAERQRREAAPSPPAPPRDQER